MREQESQEAKFLESNKILIFYLFLSSISFLFLGLIVAYAYSIFISGADAYVLPWIFYLNTSILFIASMVLFNLRKEKFATVYRRSWIAFFLILLFFFLQCIAWWQLLAQVGTMDNQIGIYFLYLLSIVHALHILGGLPFHFLYLWGARLYSALPAVDKRLLRLKFQLIHRYWHFLGIMWGLLMVIFIFHMIV